MKKTLSLLMTSTLLFTACQNKTEGLGQDSIVSNPASTKKQTPSLGDTNKQKDTNKPQGLQDESNQRSLSQCAAVDYSIGTYSAKIHSNLLEEGLESRTQLGTLIKSIRGRLDNASIQITSLKLVNEAGDFRSLNRAAKKEVDNIISSDLNETEKFQAIVSLNTLLKANETAFSIQVEDAERGEVLHQGIYPILTDDLEFSALPENHRYFKDGVIDKTLAKRMSMALIPVQDEYFSLELAVYKLCYPSVRLKELVNNTKQLSFVEAMGQVLMQDISDAFDSSSNRVFYAGLGIEKLNDQLGLTEKMEQIFGDISEIYQEIELGVGLQIVETEEEARQRLHDLRKQVETAYANGELKVGNTIVDSESGIKRRVKKIKDESQNIIYGTQILVLSAEARADREVRRVALEINERLREGQQTAKDLAILALYAKTGLIQKVDTVKQKIEKRLGLGSLLRKTRSLAELFVNAIKEKY